MRLNQTYNPNKKRKRDPVTVPNPKESQANRILDQLLAETDDFLAFVLDCPISAIPISQPKEPSLLQLKDQEEWLSKQIDYYRSILETEEEPIVIDEDQDLAQLQTQEEELKKICLIKQKELFEESNTHLQSDLLVKR